MKIAVIGANGRVGNRITEGLVKHGEDVTAFVRNQNHSAASQAVIKDVFDLNKDDLAGFDVVVDALGGWTPETVDVIEDGEKKLADLLEGTNIRLVVVGGAGSLYTDAAHTKTLMDGEDFPEIFVPVATAHAKALADLRKRKDLNWTYISPAADFQADGERTGKVIEAGEDFTLNRKGQSVISYADYADVFVNEVLNPTHNKERISFLQA
ncbi:NAD(P)-dependent oxidoreductase [uncultured Dubosiella sp.]|uniref:NAD(P)-dependent oxidoreductase n=1 Tax=uncultured Dubosiella sp. TaxID=1937011 RepID=UPI002609D43B|nr:NAD(P)H-binding protein [uncultured Dubosiella sp.]